MTNTAHGGFSIQWCDQVCLIVLCGSFNREGVMAMAAAIRQAWLEAGKPACWAHVMDLLQWEGGTADGFSASQELLHWSTAHGAEAVVRIHLGRFLARLTESRGVFDELQVPVITVSTREEAWNWLKSRGLFREGCRALFAEHG